MMNRSRYLVVFTGLLLSCASFKAVSQPLNGIYTVGGTTPDYSGVGLAVTDLLNKGLSGPVIFKIRPGVYNEPITLTPVTGSSAVNTVTFQSETNNSSSVTIKSELPPPAAGIYTIRIAGADHLILKDLTIERHLSSMSSYAIEIADKSDHITIMDCIIRSDSATSQGGYLPTPKGIYLSSGRTDHLTITRNQILYGGIGIESTWADKSDSAMLISDNFFLGQNLSAIGLWAVKNSVICNNTIRTNGIIGAKFVRISMCRIEGNKIFSSMDPAGGGTSNDAHYGLTVYEGLCDTFYNNMISVGAPVPAYSSAYGVSFNGKSCLFHHNSVRVNFSETVNSSSWALITGGSLNEIANNILSNFAMGYAYAGGAAEVYYSDYNDLYTNGSILAVWNGTPQNDLPALSAWSGMEKHSVSADPAFLSETDMHTLCPQLDKKATPFSYIKDDFDGELRNGTEPDIGADEFVLDPFDIAVAAVGPVKAYAGNNYITVTLQNEGLKSLVDSAVSLSFSTDNGITWSAPELFTSKLLALPHQTENFTFATPWYIDEYRNYLLKARINTPGLLSDVIKKNDTVTGYACVILKGGTYSVGTTTSDFIDPQAVAEVLSGLDCGGIEGPVVFNIAPGIYHEPLRIGTVNGTSEVNTITFQSATGDPADVIFTGGSTNDPVNNYTICLAGTTYAVFNKLTIRNQAPDFATGFQLSSYASDNTIRNCVILLDTTQAYGNTYGILFSDVTGNEAIGADRNSIIHNTISGGGAGIKLTGNMSLPHTGNLVAGNAIRNASINGIEALQNNNLTIRQNTVSLRILDENVAAIYGFNLGGKLQVTANHASNMYFGNLKGNADKWIANNMICGETMAAYGLFLDNCEKLLVYGNSIWFKGKDYLSGSLYNTLGKNITVLNNIIGNTGPGFAYFNTKPAAIIHSDFNDFYPFSGDIANWGDYYCPTLADLHENARTDSHSLNVMPQFLSETDLHTFNPDLDGQGIFLANIPEDFDGQQRNEAATDIGADEFTNGFDGGITGWIKPLNGAVLKTGEAQEMTVRIHNFGSNPIGNFYVSYTVDGANTVTELFTGTLGTGQALDFTFNTLWTPADTGTYTLCASTFVQDDINIANDQLCIGVKAEAPNSISAGTAPVFKLYPNPASGRIFLYTNTGMVDAALIDQLGQCIANFHFRNSGIAEMDIDDLSPGVYLVKLRSKESAQTIRLVITE